MVNRVDNTLNEERNVELRRQHDAQSCRSVQGMSFVAGAGVLMNQELGEERLNDRDAVFAKAYAKVVGNPQGLATAEPIALVARSESETHDAAEAITGPPYVTDLIKAAHGTKLDIFDLDRGFGGREQATLARAGEAKAHEVTASTIEHNFGDAKAPLSQW